MKQRFRQVLPALLISAIAIISFAGCTKDPVSKQVDYSKAPRKPVPASVVGDWSFTQVSTTSVKNQYGQTLPTTMFGATFHINADGTGFEAITSSVNTYTTSSKEDVNSDGTFEIDLGQNNTMTLKYYPIEGAVYDNDHYSHALAPEKLYPQKYYNWACTFGQDTRGVYFVSGDTKYYRK